MKKILAIILTLVMVFSVVACGNSTSEKGTTEVVNLVGVENTEQQSQELSREELENIIASFDDSIDTSTLSYEELYSLADSLLNGLNENSTPVVNANDNKDAYDENGAMTKPFDEVYPEIIEEGLVEYSDESLLVKMSNSNGGKITPEMASAGVIKLDVVVPLEKDSWYKVSLKKGTDAQAALASLRELKEITLAEYDYKIKTSAIDSAQQINPSFGLDNNNMKNEQWYLNHCGIPSAFNYMKYAGGQSSVIVAVIDTGVDIDHQDLSKNIWKNTKEIPDNGIDDDGNGYIDDYYGVNVLTNKGNGDDDNGHGTHVAGIIAAQNNNIGTVGIAYKTTIMPIKAAAASGYFLQSDIAKAILYAYENGAEVINMSFGGSACSIAVQDAIATAYTRCVLVASAGNDGRPNEDANSLLGAIPNYPAALTYVLGVMAVDQIGKETYFTNWDVKLYNGTEYELYAPGYNIMSTLPDNRYGILSGTSMAAPVVSAFAAILRSEFSDRDTYPTKFIYGQLASTSEHTADCYSTALHGLHNLPKIVDLYSALTKLPKPDVGVQDFAIFDTEGLAEDTTKVNNDDGVIDAGETISLGLILRNRWGMSKNTYVTLDAKSTAGVADPYVTFVNSTVNYYSVGTYSTQDCGKIYTDELHTGWENPFIIKISKDCPNDYIINVNVTLSYENGLDESDTKVYTNEEPISFVLTVRNGVVLPSIIDEDMTLTSDNLYIIPNSTIITAGTTVVVNPGTNIQFWSNDPKDPYADNYIACLAVEGNFLVEGTKENPVNIYPSDLMYNFNVEFGEQSNGSISLRYANITNLAGGETLPSAMLTKCKISYANHCTFRINSGVEMYYRYVSGANVITSSIYNNQNHRSYILANFGLVENSVFYKIGVSTSQCAIIKGAANRCIFADCAIRHDESTKNCVFLGNTFVDQTLPEEFSASTMTVSKTGSGTYNPNFYNNAILNRISTDTTLTHWLRIVAPTTAGVEIPLGGNYWGTTNETAIGLQLVDYADFITHARFMYKPYLTEAPEDTFPFVTSVKILNKNGEEVTKVGNEQITIRVTFNRDMDTSIPLQIRFGSAYPYGDYEVEGKYVDARTWEGKYKLTTIIENGIQYFTIENGCSATDDLELIRDRARFAFEIDTTAAQALIMQGEATNTGIHLSWTQDDFDTLMGYNVYRSTDKDGLFVRVNQTVIPADTLEFFDDTVEPGVLYYYNFTIVQTDLSESTPSGKITIMSKDIMAPNIYHSPIYNTASGSNLVISATVTDNLKIDSARVYYRTKGETEWKIAVMNNLNDKFSAIIIANHITTDGLEYYIEAFDGVSYTYKGDAENPYVVTVYEAISKDSLGDVNGDGTITNLDALMLLKATNHQINLTAEQFARADLNGDGLLTAKEALCILQYVSGVIGSVDMRG